MQGKRAAVIRISKDGTDTTYPTLTGAANDNHISYSAISKAIKDGRSCCGFAWKYAEIDTAGDTFGARLRALREKAQLSIDALAGKVGICWLTLRKYESDEMTPTACRLEALADFFHMTMDELWRGA